MFWSNICIFAQVDISDALSEKEKVKFTVHTRSSMREFHKNEFSVMRLHEDFIWLHDDIRGLYLVYVPC